MEQILIREELLTLVINREKTTTCRKGIRNYPLGATILKSNSSENQTLINILDMKYIKLKDVTDEIVKSDGFQDKSNLFKVMQEIYEDITDETDITIVYFELMEA